MKQSKKPLRSAGVTGDDILRSVQGGAPPVRDLPRGPLEGTPLPA